MFCSKGGGNCISWTLLALYIPQMGQFIDYRSISRYDAYLCWYLNRYIYDVCADLDDKCLYKNAQQYLQVRVDGVPGPAAGRHGLQEARGGAHLAGEPR